MYPINTTSFVNETDCNYARTPTLPPIMFVKENNKVMFVVFFVQKKEKKKMEDFNRLSSKIVCYNYTC